MGSRGVVRFPNGDAAPIACRPRRRSVGASMNARFPRAALVGLLAASLAAGCGSTTPITPTPPGTPASSLAANPSVAANAGPTATATPTASARPAWHPYAPAGYVGTLLVGSDGTIYLTTSSSTTGSTVVELDSTGTPKAGWPYAVADKNIWGLYLGPDGTVYVVTGSGDNTGMASHLFALDANGQVKSGWPIALKSAPFALVFGSDDTIYFSGTSDTDSNLYAVDATGKVKTGWPVRLPGYGQNLVLGADGTVYIAASTIFAASIASRVYAYGADGKLRPGWPPPRTDLQSPILAPDGTLYVAASRTVAAYEPNGTTRPTWHGVTLPGAAVGQIVVALDGTIYVETFGGPTGLAQLLALGPTGALKSGWHPYSIPRGTYWYPPVIGPTGVLYVTEQLTKGNTGVPGPTIALGPDGRPLASWPKKLVDTRGGPPTIAPDGTVYVVSGTTISTFGPDGTPKSGWPYRLPGTYLYARVTVGPDGTVYVSGGAKSGSIVVALTPAGTPVGSP